MWSFCTAKIKRISVSDCGSRTEPGWERVLPGHTELVPGAALGPSCPCSGEPARWHGVTSHQTPRTESLHSSGGSRSVWRKGWGKSSGSGSAGQDAPSRVGPCAPRPVGLSVPQRPVFIYAHHFLPPGILLLPNISALLPDFCHLFSRSWCREWELFPSRPKVTPEQGLAPQRVREPGRTVTTLPAWPRPLPVL